MEIWVCYYHDGYGYEIGEPEDWDKSLDALLERKETSFDELQANLDYVSGDYYSKKASTAFMKITF